MSIGVGLIGAGAIAEVHAAHVGQAGMHIAGVYDVDETKAAKLAEQYDVKPAKSQETLLADKSIDAVVIAVPNKFHAPVAIAAMQAGKDVLLEKPMAVSVAECDRIVATCTSTKRILQMGFINRCLPCTLAAMHFIREGRLGQIYHAKAAFCRRRGIPGLGGWFTTKEMSGGGPLIDLGVHVIDLAWHLAGRPTPLRASGACYSKFGSPIEEYTYSEMWAGPPRREGVFDVEDAATGVLRFDTGMTLQVDAVWAANLPDDVLKDGVMLWGEKGGLFMNHMTGELRLVFEDAGHVVQVQPEYPKTNAWVTQCERFRKAIETRTQPDASAAQGRTVQAMLDALYRSAREEREVELK